VTAFADTFSPFSSFSTDTLDLQPQVRPRDALARARRLSPRERQTLACLLGGDGEKQVARAMGLSRHTVHAYVKSVYRHFQVDSRPALLAQFVSPAVRRALSDEPSVVEISAPAEVDEREVACLCPS
jgi:DNA-binding CsgD family transcriptional regulator